MPDDDRNLNQLGGWLRRPDGRGPTRRSARRDGALVADAQKNLTRMKHEEWLRYRRQAAHTLESARRNRQKPATMISLLKNPRDRGERLARVQRYLAALGLERYRAIVFGSVARGDFTADSDTDLLVVSDEQPVNPKARVDVLFDIRDMAPEIEPIGWPRSTATSGACRKRVSIGCLADKRTAFRCPACCAAPAAPARAQASNSLRGNPD
jgi:predicted nucleotidyltransferase